MWELYLPEYYLERVYRPQEKEAERKATRRAMLWEPESFRARLAKALADLSLCVDREAAVSELTASKSR
jgi:hypothetical protein